MIATKQNFTRYKGDSYPIKLTLYKEQDIVMNIVGAIVTLKISNAEKTAVSTTITADLLDPINGIAEFNFSQSTFNTVGTFNYEIELLTKNNIMYTIATGIITIIQDMG